MGEVYVAKDDRLGRTVALKILRPEVANDREHRGRFEREAKALAALKHPGIVTIYALEEVGEDTFFVMDLVEGETLSKVIQREGALSVERILALAVPISDAIAAAHKQGIAHRDIKPDNIIVGPRGEVTVLDFGLAKNRGLQFTSEEEGIPGSTMGLTVEGRIFGTVNYMAPEQVEAGSTSLATDVFSLGVLIYEMATGSLPFQGDSTVSILSSILKEKPVSLSSYDNPVPLELEKLIHRCLEKDPDRRWQTALDVRNELEIIQAQGEGYASHDAAGEGSSAKRPTLAWALAGLFALCTAALSLRALSGEGAASAAPASEAAEVWTYDPLTSGPGMESTPSISPNKEFITFSMRCSEREEETGIYLLRVGGNRPIELTKDMVGDELSPRFSPSGELIAFRSGRNGHEGTLYIMGATGESKRVLDFDGFSPDWSPDGTRIVCSTEGYNDPHGRPTHGALVVIDVDSGDTQQIYAGDAVDPRWSPNGEWILFWTVGPVDEEGRFQITGRRDIGIVRADGSEARLVTDDIQFDWSPAWSEEGRKILFSSSRGGPIGLWELDFDPETGEFGSVPRPVPAPSTYAGDIDVSSDGRMIAYVDGMGSSRILRVKIDLETLEPDGFPEYVVEKGVGGLFDLTEDGEQLVVSGGLLRSDDLYISRGDGTSVRQVTSDLFRNMQPRFSRDGKRLFFFSNRSGDYEGWGCRADGGGYKMLTDGWNLINTPTIHPIDSTLAVVTAATESWYMIPEDSIELPLTEVTPMPKVDEKGSWFSPYQFDDTGKKLLGVVQQPGNSSPLKQRPFGVYDFEQGEYQVVDEGLVDAPYTLKWAPDNRRILIGDQRGLWVFDPDTRELRSFLELEKPVQGNVELKITSNGYLYYAIPQEERDIWIARRAPARKLERIGG